MYQEKYSVILSNVEQCYGRYPLNVYATLLMAGKGFDYE